MYRALARAQYTYKPLFVFVGDRHRSTTIRSKDRLIESTPTPEIGRTENCQLTA